MNLADALNLGCACDTLETPRLREQLEVEPALAGLTTRLAGSHPHLFSRTAVFLDASVMAQITDAVSALERVIAMPAWQQKALDRAPPIARTDHGPAGVFMGYDFHLGALGPRLIEINSNAGGAWLNAALAQSHRSCCDARVQASEGRNHARNLADTFVAMFRAEWQAQRGDAHWRNVLIVDDAPDTQYLAPEFQIARALLARQGLCAVVADPRELQWRDGALWHPALPAGMPVDLVYNRLTDFHLSHEGHEALRKAYLAGAAVVTPHPRIHALYADKRNLVALCDAALLAGWGVPAQDRALLQRVVPTTRTVTVEEAEALWTQRRHLFFKPAAGFGARAAYRGDKLTRRVWTDILAGDYVAQETVPPSERLVSVAGQAVRLKLDLRAYTYRGQIQLLAARTWAGQTTNFRTEGGGFAPVRVLPTQPADLAAGAGAAVC